MDSFVYCQNDLIIYSLLNGQPVSVRRGVICIVAFERDTNLAARFCSR